MDNGCLQTSQRNGRTAILRDADTVGRRHAGRRDGDTVGRGHMRDGDAADGDTAEQRADGPATQQDGEARGARVIWQIAEEIKSGRF